MGTPKELYERPINQFTASFLGKSNFIHQDGKVYALRPEKIDLRAGTGHPKARMSGTIRTVTYFGSMQRIIVDTKECNEIEVDIDIWRNQEALNAGDAVCLLWNETAAVEIHTS
ncbi:MAG: ABC-type Fe3+/spermidine/putrescine transport system ATPase subunit [Halioglobus sp.]